MVVLYSHREHIKHQTRRVKDMKKEVKFYWRNNYKIWTVFGADIDEITRKCHNMCVKYHALHFEVL